MCVDADSSEGCGVWVDGRSLCAEKNTRSLARASEAVQLFYCSAQIGWSQSRSDITRDLPICVMQYTKDTVARVSLPSVLGNP